MSDYFFTTEQLKTAYVKLKSYVYYDSGELLLREKIVEFETNIKGPDDLFYLSIFQNRYSKYVNKDNNEFPFANNAITVDQKLEIITEQLNNFHENSEFYETLIEKINITILPKKINNEGKLGSIVSNRRIKDKYFLDKVTAFIEAPIEIHILSVLWLMIEGVKIDAKLLDECIGNRLFLNKNNENVLQGSSLFKPYFKQYQKWRDGAVNSAKELLDKDKNVLFLNLDIKDYFYSVRISKEIFQEKKVLKPSQTYFNLGNILHKVHKNYTLLILESYKIPYDFKNEILDKDGNLNKFILPIGLLSSYILANDYLKDFDKVILEKYKPAYYGRYVDDILIVLSEPNLVDENKGNKYLDYFFSFEEYKEKLKRKNDNFHQANFNVSDLSEVENYILSNFHNVVSLVDNPFNSNSDSTLMESRIFKLNAYPSLFFQSEKTILHFFDKDESSIVIDKLKKELEEKSSEFRDMPNDNEDDNIFEDSAYYLNYDGSEGKIKTLKDYKENKFGLSVYLSHKINLALRNQNVLSDKEQKKIINFFKGENVLTFYRLWEKILTLFLVNNLPHNYVDFLFHCLEQIDKVSSNKKYDKQVIINLQKSLVKHLFCSHEISISLNLNFFKDLDVKRYYEFGANRQKNKNFALFTSSLDFLDPNSFQATRYRKSNMIRHHYVVIPLLNYTEASAKRWLNLVDRKTHIESFDLDKKLLEDSPRPIKFWECCIASSFKQLNKFSKVEELQIDNDGYLKTDILYDLEPMILEEDVYDEVTKAFKISKKFVEQNYLDDAYNIYLLGNTHHDNNYEKDKKNKFYFKDGNNFAVNSESKLTESKIAFANTKIEEENILNSILKSPNLTSERYNKLANILKKAREEDADLLLFPECFIPINLLSTLSRYAVDNRTLIVTGLEHITLNKTSFNFVATILPVEVNGIKDATIILRLKNNYSPGEENLINKNHLIVPKPKEELAQIINWRNLYFSVCYCFEMANITQREKLKGKIDLLIGIEWNKDTPYFSSIVEASTRDLHCYVAQVNTSNFGDTRLSQPTESALKDILKLKGGTNDLIIIGEIDTKKLRDFQRIKTSMNDSKDFKPLPPNFNLKNVLKRINNS